MTMFIETHAPTCAAPRTRVSLFATLTRFHSVWRQRQALKTLDAAALRDIGVTYAQAQAESKRPVWDAPSNWLR